MGEIVLVVGGQPAIAQLAEHLTVEDCSDQMVPGSIPGGRIVIGGCLCSRAGGGLSRFAWGLPACFACLSNAAAAHREACAEVVGHIASSLQTLQ